LPAWLKNIYGSLVVGLYFILTGIERFTEDAYRGEKHTKVAMGLKENQWIAITALVIGIIIIMLDFPVSISVLGEFEFYQDIQDNT